MNNHRNPSSKKDQKAFTFAELLAAMLFMAILIPVAIQGLTLANRAGVVAERSKIAAQLADLQLAEEIVTKEWKNGSKKGNFGEQWPNYQWSMEDKTWGSDEMHQISLNVWFLVQEREYNVQVSTLVADTTEEE